MKHKLQSDVKYKSRSDMKYKSQSDVKYKSQSDMNFLKTILLSLFAVIASTELSYSVFVADPALREERIEEVEQAVAVQNMSDDDQSEDDTVDQALQDAGLKNDVAVQSMSEEFPSQYNYGQSTNSVTLDDNSSMYQAFEDAGLSQDVITQSVERE